MTEKSPAKEAPKQDSVEIIDIPEEVKNPVTEEQAKELLSPQEVEKAKKLGIVTDEKPKEEKPKEDKPKEEKPKTKTPEEINAEDEKVILEAAKKEDLTVEEEKKVLSGLDKRGQAYYWEKKAERKKRQQAEIERDFAKTKLKAAQDELAKLKDNKGEGGDDIDKLFGEEGKPKEEGNPKEEDKLDDAELESKAKQLAAKHDELEIRARQEYPDYQRAVDLAVDLVQKANVLYKDNPKMFAKVRNAYFEWRRLAASALDNKDETYTAADAAYELGKLHPDYNKKGEEGEKSPGAVKGAEKGKNSDKIEKAIKNAEQGQSSAAFTGGSKRVVAYGDLTLADAANMTDEEYAKLPREVRERILKT